MRPRAIAASTVIALVVSGAPGAADAAADDQGDKNAQLAEAQFEVHLLTNTSLLPSDVTCAAPPTTDPDGGMLCYALIGERRSVAALAVLATPGVYRFISVEKLDDLGDVPASTPGPAPDGSEDAPPPAPQNGADAVDAAILDAVDSAIGAEEEITDTLLEVNPEIESVDEFDFYAPTATLVVSVATTTDTQDDREAIAFAVTDVMAYLWEGEQPLRDPSATIFPRLEVTVDGVLYGSSFDMMVGVADYTLTFREWLDLTRGGTSFGSASRLVDRRVEVKRGPGSSPHRKPL